MPTTTNEVLRYLLFGSLFICYAMIVWQMLYHKQWANTALSLVFLVVCFSGTLIALVIGWQEAGNWKIKKLMRIYSVLVVLCFFVAARDVFHTMTTAETSVPTKKQGPGR